MAPSERTYHSSVVHDSKLVVFGGAPSFPSFAKVRTGLCWCRQRYSFSPAS